MPVGSGYWALVAPVEQVNQSLNPSLELGTAGYVGTNSGTVEQVAGTATAGVYALRVRSTAAQTTAGAGYRHTFGNGTAYTISYDLWAPAGVAIVGTIHGGGAGARDTMVGSARWERHSVTFTEASGAARDIVWRKVSDSTGGTFYVDRVQIEAGSETTYIDGDQEGCRWLAGAHQGQSLRPYDTRAGGSVIPLRSLGLLVEQSPGIGLGAQQLIAQPYAVAPGAQLERVRPDARTFTLQILAMGTSWEDLHTKRRRLLSLIDPSLTPTAQPVRLWYDGAGGTAAIDGIIDGGAEFGQPDGFAESIPVRFTAPQPLWQAVADQGTVLSPRQALGSANYLVWRDPTGRWGTMPGGPGSIVRALAAAPTGTLFVGGDFVTANGTATPRIAQYVGGAWGSLTTGTIASGGVYALAYEPAGTLYLGGNYPTVAGTANARGLAFYAGGAYGTFGNAIGWQGGAGVFDLAFSEGDLLIGGAIGTINGAAVGNGTAGIAIYSRNSFGVGAFAWGTPVGGGGTLAGGTVLAVARSNGTLWAGGNFTSAGGTTANRAAFYAGGAPWGTLAGGGANNPFTPAVQDLAVDPQNVVWAAGQFVSIADGTARNIAALRSPSSPRANVPGLGLDDTTNEISVARALLALPDGQIIAAGEELAYSIGANGSALGSIAPGLARWTGATWVTEAFTSNINGYADYHALAQTPDGTIYLGGNYAGTAHTTAQAVVVNGGMAPVRPVLRLRHTAAVGTTTIRRIANATTGDAIYLDLPCAPGEIVTLDLSGPVATLQSTTRGNRFARILTGSNLTSFRLLAGPNTIQTFADGDNLEIAMYWRPLHSSADGGTVL